MTGLAAGCLGLVLTAATVNAQGSADPPAAQVAVAEIRLKTTGGACTIELDAAGKKRVTELVVASKSKKPWVYFQVVNGCGAAVDVSIANLRHRTNSAASDPGEPNVGARTRTIAAGATSTELRLKVRADAMEGVWDYDILLDKVKVDPGIRIDR